ncbi:MAG: HDOD domain-containing protein [Burkholderiales bacterium]|nr:HDOD domain-containing protein [Burkholderiales bacterium]
MEETQLLDHEMERVLGSVGIPPRPTILMELDSEVKKDDPDFRKIERLVSSDVGLSASLLKTVNSPFFGLHNKATTISQAVSVLGLSTLARTITCLMLRKVFATAGQISMERFWDASAKVAMATAYIAKQLPGMNRDEAYTFGLFQDCGIPVLMQRFPDYKQTLGIANQSVDRKFTDIEEEHCQTTHSTVGYLLTKSWNLPQTLSSAIRFHHEYDLLAESQSLIAQESQNLVALALLAERAIQLHSGLSNSVEWRKGGEIVLHHLGLSESEFEDIVDDVKHFLDAQD